MTCMLTNKELGIAENATQAERSKAMEKACEEHAALTARNQKKKMGARHERSDS